MPSQCGDHHPPPPLRTHAAATSHCVPAPASPAALPSPWLKEPLSVPCPCTVHAPTSPWLGCSREVTRRRRRPVGPMGPAGRTGTGQCPGWSHPLPRYIRPAHGIAPSLPLSHHRVAAMVRVGTGCQITQFWGNFTTFPPLLDAGLGREGAGGAAPRLHPANLPLSGSLSRQLTRTREKR